MFSLHKGSRTNGSTTIGKRPIGLVWRSSYWFVTFVVGLGVAVDLLVYSIIIPVMPFRLQSLGYKDVSSLTGWLLFAFSAGLVFTTIPVAVFSEKYNARRFPLVVGLIILIGSQIMLSEGRIYPLLCLARVLQGIGSAMVWVVGLALLCDSCPEQIIGQQLGIAMTGLTIGQVVGPPVGGALYSRFGFRGPVIFGLIATVLDLAGRLLVIERHEALKWGVDPAKLVSAEKERTPSDGEKVENGEGNEGQESAVNVGDSSSPAATGEQNQEEGDRKSGVVEQLEVREAGEGDRPSGSIPGQAEQGVKPLPLLKVLIKLLKSPRAMVAFVLSLVYGMVLGTQEPTIPLQLEKIWGLDSAKVGLVFLAAVVPTVVSSVASGYLTDRIGTEWVAFVSMMAALPWWTTMLIEGHLALFIVSYALATFFTFGLISPVTAELAAVSRSMNGIGYAHVYGAFNLAFGLGSAVGPIIGGPIFDHVKKGWLVICLLCTGALLICLVLSFYSLGSLPLFNRLRSFVAGRNQRAATGLHVEAVSS